MMCGWCCKAWHVPNGRMGLNGHQMQSCKSCRYDFVPVVCESVEQLEACVCDCVRTEDNLFAYRFGGWVEFLLIGFGS